MYSRKISREVALAMLDAVIALLTHILTLTLAPQHLGMAMWIIGVLQPVFVALIAKFIAEDVALIRTRAHPKFFDPDGKTLI